MLCISHYHNINIIFVFFFSSRRRHTRCLSEWSSDVCSSDLQPRFLEGKKLNVAAVPSAPGRPSADIDPAACAASSSTGTRSEERRVGKECRCGWSPDQCKKRRRRDGICKGDDA